MSGQSRRCSMATGPDLAQTSVDAAFVRARTHRNTLLECDASGWCLPSLARRRSRRMVGAWISFSRRDGRLGANNRGAIYKQWPATAL
jgi:5-methylcytosine-specific restriction endonuclease McrA